jgi:MFS family permease
MTERAQAWRNALYAGIFFGLVYGLISAYLGGWLPPHSAGAVLAVVAQILVSGTLFGLLIGLFTSSRMVPKAEDVALAAGDEIEYSGFANHFLKLEGRGGRLVLTRSELIFKPHVVNVQRSELRIPRADIASAAATRTLGVLANGLLVTLKSGKVERFVVNDRDVWVAKLNATG